MQVFESLAHRNQFYFMAVGHLILPSMGKWTGSGPEVGRKWAGIGSGVGTNWTFSGLNVDLKWA